MRRLVVLVDLIFFTGAKGGMETYVREVYSRLRVDDPHLEYVGIASSELAAGDTSWFPGRVVDSGIRGEDRAAWAWGELASIAAHARREHADLLHCPANFGPVLSPAPVVLTVHDLLAFRHPEYVPGAHARILRAMIRLAAHRATRVLTVSQATRDDIVQHLHVPSERITVTPLAGSRPPDASTTAARQSGRILAVGNRMPHKGFVTLLEALERIEPAQRPHLTITGGHGDDPLAPEVDRLGLSDRVTLRGWLSRDELDRLYAESTALVFPTRFEGFGLPPLEAMARGCPVIVSDLPVMHEVAADAAVYVDPYDPDAIAQAIRSVLASPEDRQRMSSAGLARAAEFTWERTATLTRASFVDVLEGARTRRGEQGPITGR